MKTTFPVTVAALALAAAEEQREEPLRLRLFTCSVAAGNSRACGFVCNPRYFAFSKWLLVTYCPTLLPALARRRVNSSGVNWNM